MFPIGRNWDVEIPMIGMEILSEFQNSMAYATELGLIGSLQNILNEMVTWADETLRYRIDSSSLISTNE